MQADAKQLIDDLKNRTEEIIREVRKFEPLNEAQLNWKAHPQSWSILECLEHLNLYGDYYLPELQRRITKASKTSRPTTFKSGLIGNYFALMMLPREGKVKKMKTFKDKDPINSNLTAQVITRFLQQQETLLQLLEQARSVDLNKVKTSISISRLLKLKLGDTFRVVVYHNQRHLLQAQNVWTRMPDK